MSIDQKCLNFILFQILHKKFSFSNNIVSRNLCRNPQTHHIHTKHLLINNKFFIFSLTTTDCVIKYNKIYNKISCSFIGFVITQFTHFVVMAAEKESEKMRCQMRRRERKWNSTYKIEFNFRNNFHIRVECLQYVRMPPSFSPTFLITSKFRRFWSVVFAMCVWQLENFN